MAKVSTGVSLDADVKTKAQELFADLGMDMSTAVNVFLKHALYENRFPFALGRDRPNETVRKDEPMGMTDSQYKGMLLDQLADWQNILDMIGKAKDSEIQKKIEEQIAKINEKLRF